MWKRIEPILFGVSVFFILLLLVGTWLVYDPDEPGFAYGPQATGINSGEVEATTTDAQPSSYSSSGSDSVEAASSKDETLEALRQQVIQLQSQVKQTQERFATLATPNTESVPEAKAMREAKAVPEAKAMPEAKAIPEVKAIPEAKATNATDTAPNQTAEDERVSVLREVENWRAAWQEQSVDTYIAQYAKDFRPENGQSHQVWMEDRAVKLKRPRTLSVSLDSIEVEQLEPLRWKATFRQRYQSDTYQDRVGKELTFVKVGDQYLIERERVLW